MIQNICPKCKNAVNEKDIRCGHCNMRLNQICPTCGTINRFGEERCSNCESVLIKYCENCGSANLPEAEACRKCSTVFENSIEKPVIFEKTSINKDKSTVKKLNLADIKPTEIVSNKNISEVINIKQNDYEPVQTVLKNEENSEIIEPQTTIQSDEIISENNNIEQQSIDNTSDEASAIEIETVNHENVSENDISNENTYETDLSDSQSEQIDILSNQDSYEIEEDSEIVCLDDSEQLLSHLSNIISTKNNAVITGVCAEEGMGKSTIIKSFVENLLQQNIITILAENSELIKVSPFGTIRDALLKLLTLPDIHPDAKSFYSEDTKQLFVQNFETLSSEEILDFMNFLYPSLQSDFNSLKSNKIKIHSLLEKIFTSIVSKNNAVFIIDNFDLTDNASFEFIQNLIKKGIINNNNKLFITYREKRSARVYFDKVISKQDIFATLYLNNLSEDASINLIRSFSNTDHVPTSVSFAANEKGNGNIFFIEQFLALLFDIGYMFVNSNMMKFKDDEPIPFLPKNIDEIIQQRFNAINQQEIKDSLIAASIIGYKFDKEAFAAVTDITSEQAAELLQNLTDLMFVQPVSDYEYAFKNLSMWSVIFEEAHKDNRFKVICKKVYQVLSRYALSNPIVKATVAKYCEEPNISLETWRETAAISAYLGDENIYALALEQYLLQTGYNENLTELSDIQIDLMEKISKIIYKTNPQKAIKYLTIPITVAKENENIIKVIDLSGYLIKACYLTSDYNGVIEAVDLIVKTAENEISPLDKALIISKKLNALFKTGNCEEGINLANNDIIGKLEEALAKENDEKLAESLFKSWFETSVNMINLYALQGSSKSIEIAENTAEIMQMNGINEPLYNVKLNLAKAFALTIVGKISESAKLLQTTENIPEYDNKEFISQRNLVYAMNLVFSDQTENLRDILFNFAKYAENANDQTGKHIYKLMLAWLTSQESDYTKANIIFNDELTYFAKEKVVTGALIAWLFIAQNTLMTEGAEKAEHVAMKALEVAQNPKFSQYHAAVYLQKLVAEINLLKGDGAAAKMYLEKGMLIAKQFGLDLAQIELYRSYAQFLGYMMTMQDANKEDLADKADKIYKAALISADKLKVPGLTDKISAERQEFLNYCNQNGITIKN